MLTLLPQRLFNPAYRTVRSLLIGLGLTVATTALYLAWAAQPVRRVSIAEIVGTKTGTVLIDGKPAKANAEITSGQQITPQGVSVGLRQADVLLARLAAQSSVTLENDCIQLSGGQVLLSATQGCVGAAILTSNEAVYVLERFGTVGQVKVLAGRVDVAIPSNPSIQSISLTANQKVTLDLTGDEIGPVRLMLPVEVNSILQGELFQGFNRPIANQTTIAGLQKSVVTVRPKSAIVPSKPAPPVEQPSTQAHPALVSTTVASESEDANSDQPDSYGASDYTSPRYAARSTYSRFPRRRFIVSTEQYSNPRRWARSPYPSYYRRKLPSYSSAGEVSPSSEPPSVEAPTPIVEPPLPAPPITHPPASEPAPPPIIESPPQLPLP